MDRVLVAFMFVGLLLVVALPAWADDVDAGGNSDATPAPTPEATPEEADLEAGALKKAKKIVPDPVLRQQLRDGLVATKRADLQAVQFDVQQGVVSVKGRVRTLQDRALVEAVARTLPGVREVKSKVTLIPGFRPTVTKNDPRSLVQITVDEKLRREVLARLAKITGLRLSQLQVEVYNGVVVIGGVVPTPLHAERVRHTVNFTKDARAMVIQLQTEKEDE